MTVTRYNASVEAVPCFTEALFQIHHDLHLAGVEGGPAKVVALNQELLQLCEYLSGNPYSSRNVQLPTSGPAPLLTRIRKVQEQAKALGLPNLKEIAVAEYVVLLAHSEKRVVFLGIRPSRTSAGKFDEAAPS